MLIGENDPLSFTVFNPDASASVVYACDIIIGGH